MMSVLINGRIKNKKKVEDFYANNFRVNVNYYSERIKNLIKILRENENSENASNFNSEEIDVFILNNQRRPSMDYYKEIKILKENYESKYKKFVIINKD